MLGNDLAHQHLQLALATINSDRQHGRAHFGRRVAMATPDLRQIEGMAEIGHEGSPRRQFALGDRLLHRGVVDADVLHGAEGRRAVKASAGRNQQRLSVVTLERDTEGDRPPPYRDPANGTQRDTAEAIAQRRIEAVSEQRYDHFLRQVEPSQPHAGNFQTIPVGGDRGIEIKPAVARHPGMAGRDGELHRPANDAGAAPQKRQSPRRNDEQAVQLILGKCQPPHIFFGIERGPHLLDRDASLGGV